jgi:hypothetical protein
MNENLKAEIMTLLFPSGPIFNQGPWSVRPNNHPPGRFYKVYDDAARKVAELLAVALDNGAMEERLSALDRIRSIVETFDDYDNLITDIDFDSQHPQSEAGKKEDEKKLCVLEQKLAMLIKQHE